jgi:hypothetical protein
LKIAALLFLLQVAPPLASRQSEVKASVEGIVLRSGTGEPLARAEVTLHRALSREEWLETFRDGEIPDANAPSIRTGNDGKFLLKDINPGAYHLTVTRNGYADQTYGQKILDGPSTILNLVPGQSVKNITVQMVQAGVITGRVRDALGEPIVGAGVSLMNPGYDDDGGKNVFGAVDRVATDDRGEYRFYWVPPGRYYVRVTQKAPFGNKSSVADHPFTPAFYPGTVDLEKASIVEVQPGAELSTIDVILPPFQGHWLRGRAVDAATGRPPKWPEIRLSGKSVGRFADDESGLADYNPETGTFEIPNVLPGSYRLTAIVQSSGTEKLSPEELANMRTRDDFFNASFQAVAAGAEVAIDMPLSDLNNVVLTLRPGISIPVRVGVEGVDLSSIQGVEELRVSLSSPTNGRLGPRINADGSATINNVVPGEYTASMDFARAKDLYVKEIRYGRADILDTPVMIAAPPETVTVVLSNRGGQIEGTLTDAASHPVRLAEVILIPEQRDQKRLFKSTQSDLNGHFVFRALPPGSYKLFSWEALERRAYFDPNVLALFESQGRAVRVEESSKNTADIRMIPAPKQ